MAYADERGVFNLYLMDNKGNDLCHYDPKNYGKTKDGGKNTRMLELHEEIVGCYGTYPKLGDQLFSSFGFVLLCSTRYRQK